MMNEEDRKKVFWLLKKYSSYTAWKALGDAYAKFAKEYEYAVVNTQNVSGELDEEEFNEFVEWNSDHLKSILDGQIAFEKGLPLLREGQRSVFRNTSTGYLGNAADAIVFINRIMDPEEFVFDWMPNKDEVVAAHAKMSLKTGGVFVACEADNDSSLGAGWVFDPIYGPFNIPLQLTNVPPPIDITIPTGEELPHTGIWEPEWAISQSADTPSSRQAASGFLNSLGQYAAGLLKPPTATPARMEKGCMNYLLAGTIAPKYRDGELDPKMAVTWRLIWEEDRYLDGSIPEEEQEYLAEVAQTRPDHGRLKGYPNEIVPKTGWWGTPALKEGARRYFEQGEHFPPTHTTSYGSVIWGYDPTQQPPPPEKK